jgi:chromosomal replication initiator protein
MKSKLLIECCKLFDVHPRDLTGDARFAFLTRPRFALYKALQLRGWSKGEIGRLIGGRDHSTICHGIKRADYLMEVDPDFADNVRTLAAMRSGENTEEDNYDRRDQSEACGTGQA